MEMGKCYNSDSPPQRAVVKHLPAFGGVLSAKTGQRELQGSLRRMPGFGESAKVSQTKGYPVAP